MANGTAQAPIIFTAQADDVNNINDIQEGTRGLWGGLILLGDASLGRRDRHGSLPGERSRRGDQAGHDSGQ